MLGRVPGEVGGRGGIAEVRDTGGGRGGISDGRGGVAGRAAVGGVVRSTRLVESSPQRGALVRLIVVVPVRVSGSPGRGGRYALGGATGGDDARRGSGGGPGMRAA